MPRTFARIILTTSLWIAAALVPMQASAQKITIGGDDRMVADVLRANGYTNGVVKSRSLTIVRTEACKGGDKYLVKISILGKIASTTKIGECQQAQQARFSANDAKAVLEQNGYGQINARRDGRVIVATACRNNRKYQINFNRRGEVASRQRVGNCDPVGLAAWQIIDRLKAEGYSRVNVIDDQLPRYVAEACRGNDRVRVQMNQRGRIRGEDRIGSCRQRINPDNITALLEREGYQRVEVIDRRRPPYVAHACKGNGKFEVEIGRFGQLRRENRIGRCARPIDPANLASVIGDQGYERVKVLRGSRTPYLVEGCKGATLVELVVNRFGRITQEDNVGTCATPVSKQQLEDRLGEQGFLAVAVRKRGTGWTADVCRDEAKSTIRFDTYGEIVNQRRSGTCTSSSVLDLLKTLESRGAKATELVIEGCFRNTKYRWEFDRLGNRTGRKRIAGNCS
ncbi:MAG: hypothetical protein ABJH63_03310 [Rhizobiaceae bacterium]